jgi:hypothetical protein
MPVDKLSRQRRVVMNQARDLARSGTYPDHEAIKTALERVDGFAIASRWFGDSRFCTQLNRLCELAQNKRPLAAELGEKSPTA